MLGKGNHLLNYLLSLKFGPFVWLGKSQQKCIWISDSLIKGDKKSLIIKCPTLKVIPYIAKIKEYQTIKISVQIPYLPNIVEKNHDNFWPMYFVDYVII